MWILNYGGLSLLCPPLSESLVACGTKLWLDSIDPDLVVENRKFGATGATSNPIIISDLLKTGRFDGEIDRLWPSRANRTPTSPGQMTDRLVRNAQEVFLRRLGTDEGQRRLRQLRTRSAAGRHKLHPVRRRQGEAVRRTRQAMGRRAQEPDDQSPRHARRTGGPGRARRRRRDAQRDAAVHASGNTKSPATPSGKGLSSENRWTASSRSTAFSSAGSTSTRKSTCRT